MDTGLATVVAALIAAGAAVYAARASRQARANTEHVSNGFADRVDRKLDRIIREQGDLRGDFDTYRQEHEARHDREGRRRRP